MIRRTVLWFGIGAFLGLVASMFWGPRVVSWWSTPHAGVQMVWTETEVAHILMELVEVQIGTCAGLGALLALVANIIAGRRKTAAATAPK